MYKVVLKSGETLNVSASSYSKKNDSYVFVANESFSQEKIEVYNVQESNVLEIIKEDVSSLAKDQLLYS